MVSVLYVDTSVLIAAHKAGDRDEEPCRRLLETKRLRKVIVPLGFVELCAVLSRIEDYLVPTAREMLRELSDDERVLALAEFLLSRHGVEISSTGPAVVGNLAGGALEASPEFFHASELAGQLKLRSLDLLHVASAAALKDSGEDLRALVTCDKELLACARLIRSATAVEVLHPRAAILR